MDQSFLDKKYFIDESVCNCPFCNRRNVRYEYVDRIFFDWSQEKKCVIWIIKCTSCGKKSMHLTYADLQAPGYNSLRFNGGIDIDSQIFYSVPTSFFVMDERIPKVIRELITEAEGSLRMNFLTGASACMRKAIYELTVLEKCSAGAYEEKIKSLKLKYPQTDEGLFDVLTHIQDMTSDKVHEQSWDKWDSKYLQLIIEALKAVLHEIYVIPQIKKERASAVFKLRETVFKKTVPIPGVPG